MFGSKDARKRPAAPRSRGNSPPTQRRRHSDHASATNRQNSSRDALPSYEMSQDGPGSSNSRRPSKDQVIPPASNHSGSSTLVQAAPPVPSMIPNIPQPGARRNGPMSTIETLRTSKALRSALIPQVTRRSNTTDVRQPERQVAPEPMTIATLTAMVEQMVAKCLETKDFERPLCAAENAKLAGQAELAQFRTDLEQMPNMITQTNINDGVERSKRAVTKDEVGNITQAALQPISETLDAFQGSLDKLSVNVSETQKFSDDQFRILGDKIQHIETTVTNTVKELEARVSNLDAVVKKGQADQEAKTQIGLTKLDTQHSELSASHGSLYKVHDEIMKDIKDIRAQQQQELANQQKANQIIQNKLSEQNGFKGRLEGLESQGQKTEELVQQLIAQQVETSERVRKLETTADPVMRQDQHNRVDNVDDCLSLPAVNELPTRFLSLETYIGGQEGLANCFRDLESTVKEMDKDLHNVSSSVDIFSSSIKDVFAEQFDPLQKRVEQEAQRLSQYMNQQSRLTSKLQEQAENAHKACPASEYSVRQLLLMQDMVQGSAKSTDLSQLEELVKNLDRQVAQNAVTATQAVDTVKAATRNLEDRYDNISTDGLYQRIAHMVVQQYPTSAAHVMQQMDAMKHDLAQVRVFTDIITRIPKSAQILGRLLQSGPEIVNLVQFPQGAREVPGVPDEAVLKEIETLRESSTKMHTQLTSLKNTVTDFTTKVRDDIARGCNTLTELKTDAKKEHEKQQSTEKSMALFEHSLGKIRDEIRTIEITQEQLNPLNTPIVKECFRHLPKVFTHVGQLQWVVEDLNQNLPKGGLHLDWSCDLKHEYDIQPPYPGDKRTSDKRL